MTWYPVFLNLRGKPVTVVGAGRVALRKVKGLLEAGARVTVIAPEFASGFDGLAVKRVVRPYRPGDLRGAVLAFTAADSRPVNAQAAREAKRRGIPVNVADRAEDCDFIVPARLRKGDVQIAISTGGKDPRRAAQLRRALEARGII